MTDYKLEQPDTPQRANQSASPSDCPTCGGDKFVLVRLRKPKQSVWQQEHGITPSETEMFEEYAPCPDCHNIEVKYHGFRQMDPAAVRQAISDR